MNVCMYVWMDGWMDGWMNVCLNIYVFITFVINERCQSYKGDYHFD